MTRRRDSDHDDSRSPYFQEYGPISRRRSSSDPQAETTPELPVAAPRPRRRRRYSFLSLLLWPIFLISLIVLAPPLAVRAFYGNTVLPGVTIQGMPVQEMDEDRLRTALSQRYAEFLRSPITITFGDRSWNPSLTELGVTLDLEATAQQALSVGRANNPRHLVDDFWQLSRQGIDIAPRLSVDQTRLQSYLTSAAASVEQPPLDGALSLAEGRVLPTPGQIGRQVLADATASDALLALRSLQPSTIALRTRVLDPTVGDAGLAQGVEQANTLLRGPLTLRQGERSWVWEPHKLAELLRVRREERRLVVEPDADRIAEAVERLAQVVDTGSVEPRLQLGDGGNLQVIREGKIGVALRQQEAAAAVQGALERGESELQLPVDELRPQVDVNNLAGLGISALVGEGKTSFAGSAPYRITNIKAGARLLHGVLIAPQEEFSFNRTIGEINAENGFVEGYAIIGNRTQLEWGGGICQDSTTVFRAAFWAGLPISERHTHSFYISWYDAYGFGDYGNGAGMDATIYTGVQDLKFVNDTGNWLLMQVWVDEAGQVMTVQLWGTPTGRSVRLEGPIITNEVPAPSEPVYVDDPSRPAGTVQQTDVARGGRDIIVNRIIGENGSERAPEPFFTRFKAWPNVFVRGSG